MAEHEHEEQVNARAEMSSDAGGGSLLGAIANIAAAVVSIPASIVSSMWNAATEDGVLAAAGRQGADELGKALEAFPHSIHADEIGTLFNPTQGEIASARSGDHAGGLFQSSFYSSYSHSAGPPETWPSEVAKGNHTYDPGQDLGHGQDNDNSL